MVEVQVETDWTKAYRPNSIVSRKRNMYTHKSELNYKSAVNEIALTPKIVAICQ